MNYYTSDLHFYHPRVIEFEDRPFKNVDEMNFKLIQNWNNKVCQVDDVYILGDMFMTNDVDKCLEILKILNGNKHLVVGNHDEVILNNPVLSNEFKSVDLIKEINDDGQFIVLCHYPIQVWNKKHLGALHFYGHVHSNKGTWHPMDYDIPNSFNVGVDIQNFEPVTLKEIIKRKENIDV